MSSKEYQSSSVGEMGCTYSQLRNYSKHLQLAPQAGDVASNLNQCHADYAAQQAAPVGQYNVPKYCPSGPGPNYPPAYDTLTHGGKGGCSGHFNMLAAYKHADCSGCHVQRTTRPCTGNIYAACAAKPAPKSAPEQKSMLERLFGY